jgi:hypothetical protein
MRGWRDPHAGESGTVRRVWNDAGDLLARLAFDDGTKGEYFTDELRRFWPASHQKPHSCWAFATELMCAPRGPR